MTGYADLTGIEQLPPAALAVSYRSEQDGADAVEHITVRNTSSALAFFVHLAVLPPGTDDELAPVLWDDNYFPLMPGERRDITARYAGKLLAGAPPRIRAEAWNAAPVESAAPTAVRMPPAASHRRTVAFAQSAHSK
jgi:exo-1,4-beta-D-glucosaminidase